MESFFVRFIKWSIGYFRNAKELAKRVLPYSVQFFVFSRIYEPEIKLLPQIFDSFGGNSGIAVDVGANQGIYTYLLSRICKFTQVHAFEPNPVPYGILRQKTRAYKNVTAHNAGLSNTSGVLTLNVPVDKKGRQVTTRGSFNSFDAPHRSIDVPVNTLDSFNLPGVRFIKIDVEGYEDSVLEGSMRTIIENKPVLLIEIEHGQQAEHTINKVLSLGYHCSYYDGHKLVPLKSNPIDLSQTYNVHNFIFMPNI